VASRRCSVATVSRANPGIPLLGHLLGYRRPTLRRRIILVLALVVMLPKAALAAGAAVVQVMPLRFFVVGDLPYHRAEEAPLQALLASAASEHASFIVHVGDIKSGGSPCTDEQLRSIAALFQTVPVPVVYTPGDNEWTDCHRPGAGRWDPRHRLARLRKIFFADPAVLRLAALGVIQADERYPEIYGFVVGEVLFVALHVVGSDNGLGASYAGARAEFESRDAINRAFLSRMLNSPAGQGARALVVLIQANPFFESGKGPEGFQGFKQQLVATMNRFPGPVLVVHGDTHRYQHNHPLLDPARGVPFERFTRVEVPGSPLVGGVWIGVNPDAAEPFTVKPVYAVSLETFGG
jgi:hypothetical protein